jgi:hypothetical protein
MPTVLLLDGFRFYFYSNESREPPHIHVVGHGGETKIWLPSLVVEFCYGLSPASQRRIMEITDAHADAFLEKWNEFASQKY